MFKEITACRGCGNSSLREILDLGEMELAGHFPSKDEDVQGSPLVLVQCDTFIHPEACGMVQLRHSYSAQELYGENYGYRSSLNDSMVKHLTSRVQKLQKFTKHQEGDVVLDIGSNDATLLKMWDEDLIRIGIDPTSEKFKSYYPQNTVRLASFFNADTFLKASKGNKAKAVTSIAMFYDLEDPLKFVKDIGSVLAPDGAWLFEQSYLVTMCKQTSYDTICQEHLEYYSLTTIKWLLDKAQLVIVDVELTSANGGSISIVAKHKDQANESLTVAEFIELERYLFAKDKNLLTEFAEKTKAHISELKDLIAGLKSEGVRIWGLGASTKGNIILQACGLDSKLIDGVLEVNEDKFGKYTPGTRIPIFSEKITSLGSKDILLVLPWHFRPFFDQKLKDLVNTKKVRLLYPLPEIEVVDSL